MNTIAEQRKKIGLTQHQLAQSCRWGKSRLANYEVGIRTPSLNDCRVIISALNQHGADCLLDDVFPPSETISVISEK